MGSRPAAGSDPGHKHSSEWLHMMPTTGMFRVCTGFALQPASPASTTLLFAFTIIISSITHKDGLHHYCTEDSPEFSKLRWATTQPLRTSACSHSPVMPPSRREHMPPVLTALIAASLAASASPRVLPAAQVTAPCMMCACATHMVALANKRRACGSCCHFADNCFTWSWRC